MSASWDAVVIGGGHNGLVCAAYLAAAGLSVTVLERRDVVGGAAVTESFLPGFRNSTASYTVSLLHPKVIADLHLAERGLRIVERPLANFLPLSEHAYLKVGGGLSSTQAEVARFSERDSARLPAYYSRLERVADVLRAMLLTTPPNAGGGWRDLVGAMRVGGRLRRLPLAEQRDVVELFTRSAGDVLDQWFESDPIKAALGFDAVVGNYASPYGAGSAYVLLHHALGEVNGKRGTWGHAIGGMGSITAAMAAEARARGVVIRTGAPVARVEVRRARACGVMLASGETLSARCVVSAVAPKLLFLELVEASALDTDFLERIRAYRCGSGTLRMNVALSELPDFSCLAGTHVQPHHGSGIIVAPSLGYMEAAYAEARASGMARQPIVEMLIPTVVDDTLAPPGRHVASLFCQHFAPTLPSGRSWDDAGDEAADLAIDAVDRLAPNFRRSVIGRTVLTPLDLERDFGLTSGDIFHGALGLDQLFSARPVLGHADYRAPIADLYMCASGTHPGGGVTGVPGHNAAREILRDLRQGRAGRRARR